ncbi:MAG: TRCF domain-containing protein, partial [Planctomycetota bacterium]
MKRLRALETYSMLGAGFKIALRDLEIRGAGNLLGPEQSGHIAAVGYDMYCRLLEQSVGELKREPSVSTVDTTVDLGITGALPKGFIPAEARRMDAYRRISRAPDLAAVEHVRADIVSAYGELPRSAERLVRLAEIRVAAAGLGIRSMRRHERDIIFRTPRVDELVAALEGVQGSVRRVT